MKQHPILLKNHEIDRQKWDKCIAASYNASVYAESWYLDIVSPQWKALVLDDYSAVLPITVGKKLMLQYIIQAPYTQQLGIYSSKAADKELISLFYKYLPRPIMSFQSFNKFEMGCCHSFSLRPNYELSLDAEYPQLKSSYNSNCKRNLKKAQQGNLIILRDLSPETFIEFSRAHSNFSQKEKSWNILKEIVSKAIEKNIGQIIAVRHPKGDITAAAFFINRFKRLIFLSGASSKDGFKYRSMFFLMDKIIEENSNKALVLDFEGSEIESLARFYKGFGSEKQCYYSYTHKILKIIS